MDANLPTIKCKCNTGFFRSLFIKPLWQERRFELKKVAYMDRVCLRCGTTHIWQSMNHKWYNLDTYKFTHEFEKLEYTQAKQEAPAIPGLLLLGAKKALNRSKPRSSF
jgi:hypothetical protein